MNNAQAQFWNRFYETARSIGCSQAEASRFADVQLLKVTK